MQQLSIAFGYLALSQLALMGAFYLLYFRREPLALLLTLLSICLMSYILGSTLVFEPGFSLSSFTIGRFAVATPGVLWLVAHMLFVDDKRVSTTAWIILALYQLVRAFVSLMDAMAVDNLLIMLLSQAGYVVMIALAVHVVIMALREFNNDLLESRRKLRAPFAIGLGLIVALIVTAILASRFMEVSRGEQFLQVARLLSHIAIFSFTLAINLTTFRLSPDSQLITESAMNEPKSKPEQKKILSEKDLEIMSELNSRMLEDNLYTDSELTIGILAKRLSVQEYKLRIIINRGLGYKNFNQFLNHYRITKACELLGENSRNRQISTIAHDVGYTSLSSFNLAFKTLKGITPSAFRESQSNTG